MRFQKLHIFTESGHTFTFENGEAVTNNESVLVIRYVAMSDGAVKTATFLKHRIVGWSVLPTEPAAS